MIDKPGDIPGAHGEGAGSSFLVDAVGQPCRDERRIAKNTHRRLIDLNLRARPLLLWRIEGEHFFTPVHLADRRYFHIILGRNGFQCGLIEAALGLRMALHQGQQFGIGGSRLRTTHRAQGAKQAGGKNM
ncbi:hypothetical protein D3C71_725370 [compost metagenome]